MPFGEKCGLVFTVRAPIRIAVIFIAVVDFVAVKATKSHRYQ
jgi:hypothetical protein